MVQSLRSLGLVDDGPVGGELGWGEVTDFQARYLEPPQGRGKYDNPSGRWAVNPRIGWIKPAADGGDAERFIIVTEGIADALAAARLGYDAVGVLGTAAFDQRAAQSVAGESNERSRQIVVCFDADAAGRAGGARVIDELRGAGATRPRPVCPPGGLDLTDWMLADPGAVSVAFAGRSQISMSFRSATDRAHPSLA